MRRGADPIGMVIAAVVLGNAVLAALGTLVTVLYFAGILFFALIA